MSKSQKSSEELAEDHWGYIKELLLTHNEDDISIERIGFHYKTAFIHGYKHAMEGVASVQLHSGN